MKGGKKKPIYSEKLLAIVRSAGLVAMLVLLVYGAFVYVGYEPRTVFYNRYASLAIAVSFLTLGTLQFLLKPRTQKMVTFVIFLYYVLTAFFTVMVSGNTLATYIFWLILLIATDALLGATALIYGIGYMLAVQVLFVGLQPEINMTLMFGVGVASVLTVGTAGLISWLRSANIVRYDMFEQTKAREKIQRERLSTVINSINDAIISTSSSGYVRVYNAAALNLLDTNTSLAGKRIDDLLDLYDQDGKPVSFYNVMRDIKTPIERDDLSHRFDDDQEIRLHISCAPVRGAYGDAKSPGEGGLILILRDVTKAKSLEEERDEFISVVSHELRTPVTIAEGTLSNLRFLLARGGDPKALERPLADAYDQVLLLAGMVNDLSTLSRAERGIGMDAEIIDAKEFMQNLYKKYAKSAQDKGLEFNLDMSPTLGKINVSRLCMEEVMQNIIGNAVKYTAKGGVTLMAKRENNHIHFAVKDTGIGISKTDQKNVFSKFWRSEDYRTRETSGSGLGLHITRRLAKMMGTEITMSSRLNHGSTFGFELPVVETKKR